MCQKPQTEVNALQNSENEWHKIYDSSNKMQSINSILVYVKKNTKKQQQKIHIIEMSKTT